MASKAADAVLANGGSKELAATAALTVALSRGMSQEDPSRPPNEKTCSMMVIAMLC